MEISSQNEAYGRAVAADLTRYRSSAEDSGRWVGFPFRDGDIVISTRSKHGTTWVQMLCALLVFRTPELPAPLTELSPWLEKALNAKVLEISGTNEMKARMREISGDIPMQKPAEMTEFMKKDSAINADLIKMANVKLE